MNDWLGKKVILNPKAGRDAFDLFLSGKTATVESVEVDFEDRVYLAVVLDDDEGKDLGFARKMGHRFFFEPDEVETVGEVET